jgi:AraC-like DNA-binding protein
VLATADLVHGAGFTVRSVTCDDDHTRWSAPELHDGYDIVLARRGRFRRRVNGLGATIDATMAYVGRPGGEEQFAHPNGGDVCTSIRLEPVLWHQLAGDPGPAAGATFYVDGRLDLIHRRLLAAARGPRSSEAVAERLFDLMARLNEQNRPGPTPTGAPVNEVDRAGVEAARTAILTGHPQAQALVPLAALVGVSPYRLSRAFGSSLGVPLTRYRNRVRLARALDRLERGEENLAALAADLGFADQAHLCRTARQHLGHTPTALRRLLTNVSGRSA